MSDIDALRAAVSTAQSIVDDVRDGSANQWLPDGQSTGAVVPGDNADFTV